MRLNLMSMIDGRVLTDFRISKFTVVLVVQGQASLSRAVPRHLCLYSIATCTCVVVLSIITPPNRVLTHLAVHQEACTLLATLGSQTSMKTVWLLVRVVG